MPRSGGLQRKFDSGEYQVERVHDKPSVAKSAEVQIFRERLRPNHHSGDILKHVEHGNFLPRLEARPLTAGRIGHEHLGGVLMQVQSRRTWLLWRPLGESWVQAGSHALAIAGEP